MVACNQNTTIFVIS